MHTNVHCCPWLPKELSNKGLQTYQRVEIPLGLLRTYKLFKSTIWTTNQKCKQHTEAEANTSKLDRQIRWVVQSAKRREWTEKVKLICKLCYWSLNSFIEDCIRTGGSIINAFRSSVASYSEIDSIFPKQKKHGPHRSPEKPVKSIYTIAHRYIYHNVHLDSKKPSSPVW